jgi:hypothetical protein
MQTDLEYPSPLLLGNTQNSCGDCHMKVEVVDVKWVQGMDRPVHLAVRGKGEGGEGARVQAEELVSGELRRRGFRLMAEGEAELVLTLTLRIQALRDDRFLPPGTPVRAAVLDMTLRPPEVGEKPYVRRLGASKPEWGETAEEAVTRAVKDAWAVLRPHLLEALGSH